MSARLLAWASLALSLLCSGVMAWHVAHCDELKQMAWECCIDAGRTC